MTDDLLRAQKQLGKALDRARAGEDRELATDVRERGEQLVLVLHGLLRMSRVHAADNQAFVRPIEDLQATVKRLVELLGVVRLVTVEDQVYLNDIRVRIAARATPGDDFGTELRRHNVGGITFHAELSSAEVRALIAAFAEQPTASRRRAAVAARLEAGGVTNVELAGIFRFRVTADTDGALTKRPASEVLAHAVALVDESFSNVRAGRVLNPLPLRRVVAEILSLGIDLEELWAEPGGGTAHARHAVRVCRLALLVASRLELADSVAQDLGVTGLVHDLGYALEASELETHPSRGVAILIRQRGFHEAKVRRILAVLSHHRDWDRSNPTSLIARILRIAEDYDNLCRDGGGQQSPAHVLAAMASEAGTRYDPVGMQALINGLGRYPPGTWLELEDGRAACVLSVAGEDRFETPRASLLDGGIVDLALEAAIADVLASPPPEAREALAPTSAHASDEAAPRSSVAPAAREPHGSQPPDAPPD